MPDPPNILLVLTDQQRPDWVGSNPNMPVRTPNLDALGERGAHFTNAVCPAPLCGPSRSCLASGLEYDRCGVWTNRNYPANRPSLYGRLRDEGGYQTIGVGDIDLHMDSPTWGLDGSHALDGMGFSDGLEIPGKRAMVNTYRLALSEYGSLDFDPTDSDDLPPGVDPATEEPADAYTAYLNDRGLVDEYVEDMVDRLYGDRPVSNFATTRPTPLPEDAYVDNWVGRRGLEFLRSTPTARPWHLTISFVGPHEPMDVTEEMHGWYRNPDVRFPDPVEPDVELDSATHQAIRQNYAAMCENVDRWLGRYVEAVDERGELEETIVVFASDHGELLGDHGGWTKKSPRQSSIGVPLVIAGPGIQPRGRVSEPVSLIDLYATFLDYADVDPGDVDSRSLRPYLEDETDSHREVVRSGLDPWRTVFDGRYKLVAGYDRAHGPMTNELSEWFEDEHADNREDARERLLATAPLLLFDLENDPREVNEVSESHPEAVDRLRDRLVSRSGASPA